jgi:hypothetical protein
LEIVVRLLFILILIIGIVKIKKYFNLVLISKSVVNYLLYLNNSVNKGFWVLHRIFGVSFKAVSIFF